MWFLEVDERSPPKAEKANKNQDKSFKLNKKHFTET